MVMNRLSFFTILSHRNFKSEIPIPPLANRFPKGTGPDKPACRTGRPKLRCDPPPWRGKPKVSVGKGDSACLTSARRARVKRVLIWSFILLITSAYAAGAVDLNARLQISADGQDGARTFTDSTGRHTITANGDAQIDTAQSQAGGASALFDGTGDYLTIPDSDDWNFKTDDFTIECWVRYLTIPAYTAFFSQFQSGTSYMQFMKSGNSLRFLAYDLTGHLIIDISNTWTPAANRWYDIELKRNGNSWSMFVNGAQIGSTAANSSSIPNYTGPVYIGSTNGTTNFMNGWIDELKVKKLGLNFTLSSQILDSGGGDAPTNSTNFDLVQSSLGQTAVGNSASTNFSLSGGYLYTTSITASPSELLLDVRGLVHDLTQTGVDVDDIKAVVNGEEFTAEDVPVTEGPATVHLTAKDQFEHTSQLDVNFTLDVTPPARPTINPVETPTESPTQTISGTREADSSIWLIKNSEEMEIVPRDNQPSWTYALSLNEGENNFQIYAKDQAGNESTRVSSAIYLDLQNPNVQIIYPANGAKVNQTTLDVLGTVDDDQTTVTVEANGVIKDAVVQNRMFVVQGVVLVNNSWNAVTAVATSPSGKEFPYPISVRCETTAVLPNPPTLNNITSPTNQATQVLSGTKPSNTYLWLNGAKRADVSFPSTSWSFTENLLPGGNPNLLYVKDSDSASANVSRSVSAGIFYDSTAPTRPLVIDDGVSTDSKTSLSAKWSSDDSETDIVDNFYSIGTAKGAQDIVPLASVGTNTQVTRTGLSLEQGKIYYFTVITKNAAGSQSEPGYSDGIRVNGSVPKITNVSLLDLSKIYQGTNGINIAVTAEDQDGDTLQYRFTIDGQIVQNWSADVDYVWNVPPDAFGRKHVVVEVKDPVGGQAYKDIRVFILKQPIAVP